MQATVIDTLRYANRLKDAGVDGVQAEAMAFAINDGLVSGLATKDDLNQAVGELRAELGELRGELGGLQGELRRELGELRGELRGELGELRGEMDSATVGLRGELDSATVGLRGELGELRAELGALGSKFETQGRHVFLVLALIAALGLFNAVAPHFGRTNPAPNPSAEVSAPQSPAASSPSGKPLERLGP